MSYPCARILVDCLGRPFTENQRLHHRRLMVLRREWRAATRVLAAQALRGQSLPLAAPVRLIARTVLADRRGWPDQSAEAPTVKAMIDGLVDAGALVDDSPEYLAGTTYLAPELRRGAAPGVELWVVWGSGSEYLAGVFGEFLAQK